MSTLNTQAISNTTNAASTAANASSNASAANALSSQNFMTMLVAQLQNQDPTNPIDNAQMTSQLAQLSTVDGINQLNTTMSSFINNTQSSMAYQAANLIGRNVVVSGNQMSLNNGQAPFSIQLASAADTVNVNIKNSANQIVRTLAIGAEPSGSISGTWNGKDSTGNQLTDGTYTFDVQASNAGQAVTASGTTSAMVNSISQAGSNVMLNLSNNSAVNASSLLQIN
jgi:flagellar basal-body rod modification protein FlgD